MRSVTVLLLVVVGLVAMSYGGQQVYSFRCGDCRKVEQYTDTGTHYCTGTSGREHSKRIMERIDDEKTKSFRYRCGDCRKVERYTDTGTHYCTGVAGREHSKRIMERID